MNKPLLCLDFDGVIHSYTSGWKGAAIIPDPPVPGAIEFIIAALEHFDVAIFSSRSGERGGIDAMKSWLGRQIMDRINEKTIYDHRTAHAIVDRIEWPKSKPPAFLTIDDRALTFSGWWPKPEQLLGFKTWQQESGQRPLVALAEPAADVLGRIAGNTARELARAAARVPFAWARQDPDDPEGPLMFSEPWLETKDGEPTRSVTPPGDGWFPLYRED